MCKKCIEMRKEVQKQFNGKLEVTTGGIKLWTIGQPGKWIPTTEEFKKFRDSVDKAEEYRNNIKCDHNCPDEIRKRKCEIQQQLFL